MIQANDQQEIENQIEVLKLKTRYLAAQLQPQSKLPPKLPALSGDIILDLETLERHCVELERKLEGNPTPTPSNPTDRGQSATPANESFIDRALRENGCTSVAELRAKCEVQRLEKIAAQYTGTSRIIALGNLNAAKSRLRTITNHQLTNR